MPGINPFCHIPPAALLYFHYGLAFIFLGAAIAFKNMRGSRLRLAGSLYYLAVFGFAHGTHEWLELYLIVEQHTLNSREFLNIKFLELFIDFFSFMFLLQFGLILLRQISGNKLNALRWLHLMLLAIWATALCLLWFRFQSVNLSLILHADTITRYCFGFTGSLLAGLALIIYSRSIRCLSKNTAINLTCTGITFVFYGVLAGLVPSKTILPWLHIPVELLRMICAILITGFTIKALNIFDIETREQLVKQMKLLVQAEKLASLGQLAAGVAHEINNPLTNSSLNLQMVRKQLVRSEPLDRAILKKIDAVARNIDRASTIARELLQFSHNDEQEFLPIDINEVIRQALVAVDYLIEGITIVKQLSNVPKISGYQGGLQQVFINIMNNSMEAMTGLDRREIRITTSQHKNKVRVEIADSGSGMTKEQLTNIFDPFFTTKKVGTGTGLGLSICYGIIRQHNGTIDIFSDIDQGTTVVIEFPVLEDHEIHFDC
jgi:two-component system NtrC family sensor kinase